MNKICKITCRQKRTEGTSKQANYSREQQEAKYGEGVPKSVLEERRNSGTMQQD